MSRDKKEEVHDLLPGWARANGCESSKKQVEKEFTAQSGIIEIWIHARCGR